MRDLKNFVQTVTKPLMRKNGFVTPQIIFDWPLIVGDYLAESTTPIKINFPKNKNCDGVLFIEVIGAQAPIIQQLESEIIEKIAIYFGFKAVAKIKLIHSGEMPKQKTHKKEAPLTAEESIRLDKLLEDVKDIELRDKLKSIGEHVIRRKQ